MTASRRRTFDGERAIYKGITTGGVTFLIDALGVTAVAAYSTRHLRSAYAGSALRVRRSSDNTEQDIGFVGEDLDTGSMATFVGANSGFITKWYDQSGSGFDAIQATAANQPRIVLTGTNDTRNTKVCPFFIQANSTFLAITTALTVSEAIATFTFNVATFDNYHNAIGGVAEYGILGAQGTNTIYPSAGLDDGIFVNNVNTTTCTMSGSLDQFNCFKNSGQSWTGVEIGETQSFGRYWNGWIGEAVLFTGNLSAGNRTTAYNNQKAYWGTP